MARNLNHNLNGSKCYAEGVNGVSADSVAKNCANYGRLYNWSTAIAACPNGWSLPSNADWDELCRYVDNTSGTDNLEMSYLCSSTAGNYLKATSGWKDSYEGSGNGTDDYGFAALPGGDGDSSGKFADAQSGGYWWSATEYNANETYIIAMGNGVGFVAKYSPIPKTTGLYSVRCVKN